MRDAMTARMRRACLLALLSALTVSCASRIPAPAPAQDTQAPTDFPATYYRQAEALGKKVLRVKPARSLVTIEVRRGGRLARLGHDHVVASHDVTGYVAPEEGRADLYIPLERLAVDEPELRTAAGLDPQLATEAIAGTRRNMLDKVLEAERFPYALIRITRARSDSPLNLAITLHGVTRAFEIPAQIETVPGAMVISGRIGFNQTDFGMVPFSVFGGALQVQDRVELRFRIVAEGG